MEAAVGRVMARFEPYFSAIGVKAEVLDKDEPRFAATAGNAIKLIFGDPVAGATREEIHASFAAAAAFNDSVEGVRLLVGHRAKGFWDSSGTRPGVSEVMFSGMTVDAGTLATTLRKIPHLTVTEPGNNTVSIRTTDTNTFSDLSVLLKDEINGSPRDLRLG